MRRGVIVDDFISISIEVFVFIQPLFSTQFRWPAGLEFQVSKGHGKPFTQPVPHPTLTERKPEQVEPRFKLRILIPTEPNNSMALAPLTSKALLLLSPR